MELAVGELVGLLKFVALPATLVIAEKAIRLLQMRLRWLVVDLLANLAVPSFCFLSDSYLRGRLFKRCEQIRAFEQEPHLLVFFCLVRVNIFVFATIFTPVGFVLFHPSLSWKDLMRLLLMKDGGEILTAFISNLRSVVPHPLSHLL